MKIFGERPVPSEDFIVLPVQGRDIVIRARASANAEKFQEKFPAPKPPSVRRPSGQGVDLEDPDYLKALADYESAWTPWVIMESLKATEGLEWEDVKEGDLSTFKNLIPELSREFGSIGANRIVELVNQVNFISDTKLNEAKARFLASQAAKEVEVKP